MNTKVVRGFRRAKHIRDHLVRAKISPIRTSTPILGTDPPTPVRNVCTTRDCTYCRALDTSGQIIFPVQNRRYMTRRNVCCRSSSVIYCIRCQACGNDYVGQTKRRLVERMREHYRNVRQNCTTHIIGRHYNSAGHVGIPDMRVYILEFIRAPTDSQDAKHLRDICKRRWIYQLRLIIPTGLNVMD